MLIPKDLATACEGHSIQLAHGFKLGSPEFLTHVVLDVINTSVFTNIFVNKDNENVCGFFSHSF
jgi:hypothetical protein